MRGILFYMEFFAPIALGIAAFFNAVVALPSTLYDEFTQQTSESAVIEEIPNEPAASSTTQESMEFTMDQNTDHDTFSVLYRDGEGMYAKDQYRVYYTSPLLQWKLREIEGADPHTFEVLFSPDGTLTHYGKDKDRTYMQLYVVATDDAPRDAVTKQPSVGQSADQAEKQPPAVQVADLGVPQETDAVTFTVTFDALVKEKQALGIGIGPKFDPNTTDASADAIAHELTHVLDYMKKGADLYYTQYSTYSGYCENADMKAGMKTLLKRFEGWISKVGCISDTSGAMSYVQMPVAGLYCVDTKGYADVIRDFSLFGHTGSACPVSYTAKLSNADLDKLIGSGLRSLQNKMYAYKESNDSYTGGCESSAIVEETKILKSYGSWQTYCYADQNRFLIETRMSSSYFGCVDSKGNAYIIYGTSQYKDQCDVEGATEFLERVQSGDIQACTNGVCVPLKDYDVENVYTDTWDEL